MPTTLDLLLIHERLLLCAACLPEIACTPVAETFALLAEDTHNIMKQLQTENDEGRA